MTDLPTPDSLSPDPTTPMRASTGLPSHGPLARLAGVVCTTGFMPRWLVQPPSEK